MTFFRQGSSTDSRLASDGSSSKCSNDVLIIGIYFIKRRSFIFLFLAAVIEKKVLKRFRKKCNKINFIQK